MAKSYIDSNYNKYQKKFDENKEKELLKKKKKEEEEKAKTQPQTKQQPTIREITPEEAERLRNKKESKSEDKEEETKVEEQSKKDEEEEDSKKPAEGKVMPNSANGYNLEKYVWSQPFIHEVNITVPVDENIRGKDLTVKYDTRHLLIKLKSEDQAIIDGDFFKSINVLIYTYI